MLLYRNDSRHSVIEKALSAVVLSPFEPLTKREKEVLQLMSEGMSNKETAEALKLAEGTIKNHIFNIYSKLQVNNRIRAIALAKEAKIINYSPFIQRSKSE
jgi:DNA-binding NarL/FixJ family response regulator